MRPSQHTVFSRLVRMQISIIIVLVMAILLVYLGASIYRDKRQIDTDSVQSLQIAVDEVEYNVLEFVDSFILNFLLSDSDIVRPFKQSREELTLNQIAQLCGTLRSYLFTNSLFHSIYIEFDAAETIASTNGVYFLNGSDAREDVKWISELEFSGTSTLLLLKDYKVHYTLSELYAQDVVAMVRKYPALNGNGDCDGYVAVNLKVDEIYGSIAVQKYADAFVLISTPSGEILPNANMPAELSDEDEQRLIAAAGDRIRLGGHSYYLYRQQGESGLYYNYLVPANILFGRLQTMIVMSVIIALVSIGASMLAPFWLTRNIYMPIAYIAKRSQRVTSDMFRHDVPLDASHEAVISSTLDLLLEKVDALQNEINTSEADRCDSFMQLLFSQRKIEPAQLMDIAARSDIRLPYANFACIVMVHAEQQDPDGITGLDEELKGYVQSGEFRDSAVLASTNIVYGVCVLINSSNGEAATALCNAMYEYLCATTMVRTISALSAVYEDISHTSAHFKRLCDALRYRFLLPDCERFSEEQVDDWDTRIYRVDYEQSEKLMRALKTGDESRAYQSLNAIKAQVTSKIWSIDSVKNEIAILQNRILEMLDVLISLKDEYYQHISSRMKAASADDVYQAFDVLQANVQNYFAVRATQTGTVHLTFDMSKVLQYIDDKVAALDMDALTLKNVADRFEKNPSYLSTVFPNYAGMGFKEYVSGKKLEKAAQELRRENAVVRDVANALGYYNVSNFIKLFKQQYGCTPGQYHEQAMLNEQEERE